MLIEAHLIVPDWPAPSQIHALQTTRLGGVSLPPYDSFNLGSHVGDQALSVTANRQRLSAFVPSEPIWLEQVHGTQVVLAEQAGSLPRADACISRSSNAVCAVMTADCLPVLLCDDAGTVVGATHAGWRGLLAGVIEATVQAMQVEPQSLMAWLGPAIGPQAFEVGETVRTAFIQDDPNASADFVPVLKDSESQETEEKFFANLDGLARRRLNKLGIQRIHGGHFCTYSDPERFYSYRRDGVTGRMATLIWLGHA